jgi:hypothetical protein
VPRVCTICTHEEHHEINVALVQRDPYRHIASRWNVSTGALQRHAREHIPRLLTLAADAERAAQADSLLDRIEALQSRTLAILEATEETHEHRTALVAIAEARRNLELIGEVTKELDRKPTFNLHLNAEWIETRTAILYALEPYSEARESVLRAIGSVGNGSA